MIYNGMWGGMGYGDTDAYEIIRYARTQEGVRLILAHFTNSINSLIDFFYFRIYLVEIHNYCKYHLRISIFAKIHLCKKVFYLVKYVLNR